MPLAIVRPEISFTLVDSTAKKLDFVRRAAAALSLRNAAAVCARAEELARRDGGHRARYDVGVSRAVAALPTLAELTLPLLRAGGTMLCMKGPPGARLGEELRDGRAAAGALGAEIESVDELGPDGDGDGRGRTVVVVRKSGPTPSAYPRSWQAMRERPLGAGAGAGPARRRRPR